MHDPLQKDHVQSGLNQGFLDYIDVGFLMADS